MEKKDWRKIKVKKRREITETRFVEETEEKYVWWVKFLRWLFQEEYKEFIDELEEYLVALVKTQVENEMYKYKRQMDAEILDLIDIATPALEVTSDLDNVSLMPEPVLIGNRAYPKRLITKKHKSKLSNK